MVLIRQDLALLIAAILINDSIIEHKVQLRRVLVLDVLLQLVKLVDGPLGLILRLIMTASIRDLAAPPSESVRLLEIGLNYFFELFILVDLKFHLINVD